MLLIICGFAVGSAAYKLHIFALPVVIVSMAISNFSVHCGALVCLGAFVYWGKLVPFIAAVSCLNAVKLVDNVIACPIAVSVATSIAYADDEIWARLAGSCLFMLLV